MHPIRVPQQSLKGIIMRYHALACDFDRTLAHEGQVDATTLAALQRLLATGRRLILVTGRELEDLQAVFPQLHLFSRVVVENGALLYRPASRETKALCQAPPGALVQFLRKRKVPLSVGAVIVATVRPHEVTVLEAIHELGLEMQVIFNKESVMVLPSGVNKATGLAAALQELGLTPHETVGIGDAENDQAFLELCGCAAAVANALPALKEHVDLVTHGSEGAGVVEVIDALVENDLGALEGRLTRHPGPTPLDPHGFRSQP
jgi:hydroxymethylpyrimidine pyrophosphatase-like HAD family hydrolase